MEIPEVQAFKDSKPDSRRDTLSKLVAAQNFSGLRDMGVDVIDKGGDVNISCYETAFPRSKYSGDILSKVVASWEITDSPKVGDVAIYINVQSKAMTHIGRVIENGRIRSRWGMGGILCEHSPLDIPVYCGKELEILYFREPK